MSTLLRILAVVACVSLTPACGRSTMEPTECMIQVDRESQDFGDVLPGEVARRQVRLMNVGGQSCPLSFPVLAAGSDDWFSVDMDHPLTVLAPQQMVSFTVAFQPETVTLPLTRTGILELDIGGSNRGQVRVPLAGRVKSDCHLAISPRKIDFGTIQIAHSATQTLRVENVGEAPCEIRGLELEKDGDSQFNLPGPFPPIVGLEPNQSVSVQVAFAPLDDKLPRERVSALVFSTSDDANASVKIPLVARIDIGCELSWTPTSVEFGKVTLNKTTTTTVSLKNTGTSDCWPTNFAFTKDSHPDFVWDQARPLPTRIPPNGTDTLAFTFLAADVALPHLRTATFVFLTSDKRKSEARIPLSATMDTFCKEASKWIYTVDTDNTLSKFDPSTMTFTTIATLKCPNDTEPYSMAVDQDAVAWVAYSSGRLYKVDTTTGKCEATAFVPDPNGVKIHGMGFVFDPATNTDTLYVVSRRDSFPPSGAILATISFPQLQATTRGTFGPGGAELSGTGDGALWGFSPHWISDTNKASLVQIDTQSGTIIERYQYPDLTTNSAYAMKFWGGSFWIFQDFAVYEVKRDDPKAIVKVIPESGHDVVGAGVSSCAPLRI